MIVKVLLLSIVLMAFVFLGFAISILLKKNGKFPEIHIGKNKALKDRGIGCATTQDKMEHAKTRNAIQFKKLSLLDKELESL
nr:hypothetical protein [uncultured Marinifilum sp.]